MTWRVYRLATNPRLQRRTALWDGADITQFPSCDVKTNLHTFFTKIKKDTKNFLLPKNVKLKPFSFVLLLAAQLNTVIQTS